MGRGRARNRYHAFVCYADDCERWAKKFIENLEGLGLKIWHRGRARLGEDADDGAKKAIAKSGAVIQIVSPGAFCSRHMLHDMKIAAGQDGPRFAVPVSHRSPKLIRVLVSDYDDPDDRIPAGLPAIRLVSYEKEYYKEQIVRLADDLLRRKKPGNPAWSRGATPEAIGWPVDARVWNSALDVMEFAASFTGLWREWERCRDRRYGATSSGVDSAQPENARGVAYRYLYSQECHASLATLAAVLATFKDGLEAATKFADFGRGGQPWWREVYAEIEQAVGTAKLARELAEDEAARREEDERAVAERHEFERMQAEQEAIAAERARAQHEHAAARQTKVTRAVTHIDGMISVPMTEVEAVKSELMGVHGSVDFLIITPLEEERDAVLSKLPDQRKLDRDGIDANTYYEAHIKAKRDDGAVYRVIVTSLSGMGPRKGATKAGDVIRRWHPTHVLVVGIAGGVEGEVALGDVIVASHVTDYTVGKVRGSEPREERWEAYPADAYLLDAARNFSSGWEDLIMHDRSEPGLPRRRIGVVASGGDVIASKEVIAAYRADWPKLIGVEMEGGAVAGALHDHIERPRFLMIRGVSDWADGESNAEVKEAWRAHACHVAAAYAIGFLRDGPVRAARGTSHAAVDAPARPAMPQVGTTSLSATPTWEELEALPSRYEANPFDDIVLCMHPDCERAWRQAVRAGRMEMQCVTIDTPEGEWHRKAWPDPGVWKDVVQQINAKVQQVRAAKVRRVHLLAKAPFSLGALLGARIDPQNHELVVYQLDNRDGSKDQKVWRGWGPAWQADPGTRVTNFFDIPPGLEKDRPEQDGGIAIVVDITGKSILEPCVEAVKAWSSGRPVLPLLIRARDITPQGTIRLPADVDKAAGELERLFQQIAESLPNATLHLFYYGPLAILIRASRGLWLRRRPVVIWHAAYPDGKPHWFPAVTFPEGRLLIETPDPAASPARTT